MSRRPGCRLKIGALSEGTALLLAGATVFSPIAHADPGLTPNPTSVDFGTVAIGSSATRTVTLTNNGAGPATIKSITTSGSPFSESHDCPIAPATLDAGMACHVFTTFTPATAATYSGVLVIDDDPIFVSLTGTGGPGTSPSGTGGNSGGNTTTGGNSSSGSSSSSGSADGGTSTGGAGGAGTGGNGAVCGAPSGGLINIGPICFGRGGNGTGGNGGNAGNANGGTSSSDSSSQSGNGGNAGNGTGSANGNGNGGGGSASSGNSSSGSGTGHKKKHKKPCESDGIRNNCKKKKSSKKH